MADALDKIRAGVDKARTKLAASRLGGREFDVTVSTLTGGDDLIGTLGTWGGAITLAPRPATVIKGVFRATDGGVARIGDATVSGISRSYTEEQLRGTAGGPPTRWTINGRSYSVVSLEGKPTEWIAVLRLEGEDG